MIVSFITRNSYSRLSSSGISLQAVLDAPLQVPYQEMILVDDSDDSTRDFIRNWSESHDKRVQITGSELSYVKPTRATARQTTIDSFIRNFSDDWIFSLTMTPC